MDLEQASRRASTRVWIPFGAVLFLIALGVSALVIPQLRLLHFLQGLIYVAIIVLARRSSPWAYGAGVTVAAAWNSLNLFVTHLMQAGAIALWSFMRSGQVRRPDTMMVTVAGIAHFVLIIACLDAVIHSPDHGKWRKFVGGGVLAIAYLVLIVAVARPR
jgi:hypothetical protein